MKKNIAVFILLLSLLFSCTQKKIDTVTLSNGRTIIIYDNQTWDYANSQTKLSSTVAIDSPKADSINAILTTDNNNHSTKSYSKPIRSSTCGAPTKKGGPCKRKVAGEGRCWQH